MKGEYLEGKMHGIIKKFEYNGKLIFEGEYRRGKMHGTVKEFNNFNGKLIFEGEYLNGKRNGKEKNIIMVNYNLMEIIYITQN